MESDNPNSGVAENNIGANGKNADQGHPTNIEKEKAVDTDVLPAKFPLRTFRVMFHGRPETFLFLSDVLVVRLHFMKENDSSDRGYYEQQLDNEHNNEEIRQMVRIQDFQVLIDDGVIDPEYFTVTEDLNFKQKRDTFWNKGQGWVKLSDHTSETYCFAHHALLQIFKRFICGFKWDEQICEEHPDCLENFKSHINTLIGKYKRMPNATVVRFKTLFSEIVNLANHCSYKKQRFSTAKLMLNGQNVYAHHCDEEFEKTCQLFGFVNFRKANHIGFGKQNKTVYATRVYCLLEWAKSFSDGILQIFATILIYGVFELCPRNRWKYLPGILEHRFAFYMSLRDTYNMPEIDCVEEEDGVVNVENAVLNQTTPEEKNDKNVVQNKETKKETEAQRLVGPASTSSDSSHASVSLSHTTPDAKKNEEFDQNKEAEKENNHQKGIKSDAFPRPQRDRSALLGASTNFIQPLATDRCIQCFANLGERKKAETESREWRKKANLYEKQSNKYEELEREYAKMKGKFENACKRNVEHKEKHVKELEEAVKTKPKEEVEVELLELKKKFKEKQQQLSKQTKSLKKLFRLRETVTSQKKMIDKLKESKKSIEKSQSLLQNRATENTKKVGDLERTVQNQEDLIKQLTESSQSLHKEKDRLKKQITSNEAQHKQEIDRMNQQMIDIIDQVEDKNRKEINEKNKKIQDLEQKLCRAQINRQNSSQSASSSNPSSSDNQFKKLPSIELEEDECAFCSEPIGDEELFHCVNPKCPPIHNKCMQEHFKRSGQLFHQICGQCQNMVKDTKNFPGISG